MGRTGIRGKGIVWRWGPNHVIKAVVTRWRRKYGPDLSPLADFLYVEGKRVLEFITVQKESFMDSSYALPGVSLPGLCIYRPVYIGNFSISAKHILLM